MKNSPKFEKILATDVETSGLTKGGCDPSINHQIISIGMIVASTSDFKPQAELYLEIQHNGKDKWDSYAEAIHGLSKQHLKEHGSTEEAAAEKIAMFLYEHFGTERAITCLGQNVGSFDVMFIKKLLNKYDVPFKFSHRQMDTFSLSMPTVGAYSSDELFEIMGFPDRGKHNALDDARMALKSVHIINKMWKKAYG